MDYQKYINSPEWKERARRAIKDAGHRCQRCSTNTSLQVHHQTYTRLGRELPQDLVVLCRNCHTLAHTIHCEEDLYDRPEFI